MDKSSKNENSWHGRGGQGAVTSAELMAQAAIAEGMYAQAFPSFGPERRGAPVLAFVRISASQPIRLRYSITEPDVVVVLDPGLLRIVNVTAGLKPNGIVVINTTKTPEQISQEFGINAAIATVDATRIAREVLGVPITNTTMIGAVLKATDIIKLDSFVEPVKHRLGRLADRNIAVMKKAYEETVVKEIAVGQSRK
ncbi:MAG: 2-oxoacid:acceptor oxidoreductase family protein [Dehalococcoidia bacterium]|nr:2-oxoacid:acceptor oxidoreductase family protein [Dehalococcoidia bacterium]